jgi:hypothetical protein
MSFRSETFRVLIASPSDLREERRVAADAIADWNAEHALAEGVVLLPVMWETHAMPQAAARPQEAINQQIVCESDILVGMFWTKLGVAAVSVLLSVAAYQSVMLVERRGLGRLGMATAE